LHREACGLIERSGLARKAVGRKSHRDLTEYEGHFDIKAGVREIRRGFGRIRTLPADVTTTDGVIPTLALVDELHRHPNGDLYGVFRDGLVEKAQMITITTPGASMTSFLGELRKAAMALDSKVEGKRRTYASRDFVLVEWGLAEGDDPDNLNIVKQANPLQTMTKLRQRRDSPSMKHNRWQWLRFGAGLWVGAEGAAILPDMWDPLRVDIGKLKRGEKVWLGIRTGQEGGSGIGIVAPRSDGAVAVAIEKHGYSWPALVAALRRLREVYEVRDIFIDHRQFGIGWQVIEDSGLPLSDHVQSPIRLVEATATFVGLVGSGKVLHAGDEELRGQVLQAHVKETTTGAYFQPVAEINAFIGLIMAVHQMLDELGQPTPKIHFYKGA
jgi:phage terminase large subunit-like protein